MLSVFVICSDTLSLLLDIILLNKLFNELKSRVIILIREANREDKGAIHVSDGGGGKWCES